MVLLDRIKWTRNNSSSVNRVAPCARGARSVHSVHWAVGGGDAHAAPRAGNVDATAAPETATQGPGGATATGFTVGKRRGHGLLSWLSQVRAYFQRQSCGKCQTLLKAPKVKRPVSKHSSPSAQRHRCRHEGLVCSDGPVPGKGPAKIGRRRRRRRGRGRSHANWPPASCTGCRRRARGWGRTR